MAKKIKVPGIVVLKEQDNSGVNQKLYEPGKVENAVSVGAVCVIALVVLGALLMVRFVSLDKKVDALNKELNATNLKYDTDVKQLTKQNDDLEEKIVLLSNKLVDKLEQEEVEDAKHIPSGLPVSGMVSIVSEPATETGDGDGDAEVKENDYPVVFSVNKGSKVMASGSGIVSEVTVDDTYGFKVVIDHGNGYVSEYFYSEIPKVSEGDEVMKSQLLYESVSDNSKLCFKIKNEEEYFDPMEILEING